MAEAEAMDQVAAILSRYQYRYSSEADLHERIETVLEGAGLQYQHEHRIDALGRFDFLLEEGLVIEVKVQGTRQEALRQAARYCQYEAVSAVLIAGTPVWAQSRVPVVLLNGKPVRQLGIKRRAF